MRRLLALLAALSTGTIAQAQDPTPGPVITDPVMAGVEAGIRVGAALAATAAARHGPDPTPTPPAWKEGKPLAVQPDGSSVDAIVTALYASVSHGPDYEPNWIRLRALFLPKAIVVPPKRPEAEAFAALDAVQFEDRIRRYIAGRRERKERLGFTEREVARRERCFGSVCQAFSTYETVFAPGDTTAFARGVHSIQLVDDGRRWWIAALVWDNERPDNPIPPDLLAP
jgi:hypothetical protein